MRSSANPPFIDSSVGGEGLSVEHGESYELPVTLSACCAGIAELLEDRTFVSLSPKMEH
jgi:hypothetical protein